jgi:Tfp pilus assembly protein PilW
MKTPLPRWTSPLLGSGNGFTLVELAVGTAIGALVIIITTAVLAPQLRINQRLGGQMRLQERWSRVNTLLNTEIQEAHQVQSLGSGLELITCEANDASSTRCSDGGYPTTGSFGYDVHICYELIPDSATGASRLQRRGPSIDQAGALLTQGTTQQCGAFDPEVVTTGVTAFSTPTIADDEVRYTISFRDPFNPNGATIDRESTVVPRPRKY